MILTFLLSLRRVVLELSLHQATKERQLYRQ
jgi:hypothetical protein